MALRNPLNPITHTPLGRSLAAAAEIFERVTRRYDKPDFDIEGISVEGRAVPVREEVIWARPFCRLLHFRREFAGPRENADPKLLIVAPLSGHYATLLRGTVRTMLQAHDVYVVDWVDARMVPVAYGAFDLDDYIDYLIEIFRLLEGDVHVMAVCQPSVPVLAAVALMETDGEPHVPQTMTLMGGPVDTRANPTAVNAMAKTRSLEWFRRNVIMNVPWPHPGVMREVYPGFLQLTGFMTMNLDRHLSAHRNLFDNLVRGDGESAEKHRNFYDEYLAVMDLDAAFYLQTVETVFMRHALPNGEMRHRDRRVDPSRIKRVALMTVEGENDDISGVGQTQAAHALCTGLSESQKLHHLQPSVGHFGVFNGTRFEAEVAPRISGFIATHHKAR
jgi:poly(3-hydroxybutyrate) depolymerase